MPRTWAELKCPFHPQISAAINALKFPHMTPIQAATIPQLLAKKDVAAEAVTGSGKTLAFLIPMLQMLKEREAVSAWKKGEIGAVVVSPTRELAVQTNDVLQRMCTQVSGISVLLLVGGSSIEEDLKKLRELGGNIVICTPGRLEDLFTRHGSTLPVAIKSLEILVLDEADRLLDLGFQTSLNSILSYLPRQRRTGLFSATQTKQVEDLIRAGLRNPVLISVNAKAAQSTPENLQNYYMVTRNNGKLAALLEFLMEKDVQRALVFLPTCACVDYWAKILQHLLSSGSDKREKKSYQVLAIHGKMKEKRKKVLERFMGLGKAILLCTDVLARGIDLPEVDWVLQWDPPANASAFVHRVGRTARQDAKGSALIFLLENEESYVHFIKQNQRVVLEPMEDLSTESNVLETMERIRDVTKTDRDLLEKGTRAFVSHVRAYTKHECSVLLRVQEWPLAAVAATYGLLTLPKMPELRNRDTSDFPPVRELDVSSIPYRDKTREKARLQKMKQFKETGSWPSKRGRDGAVMKKSKKSEPWSLTKSKKEDRKERRAMRKRKREEAIERGAVKTKKKKKAGISEEDMAELARDIALLKKMKKKKLSNEEFEKQFGLSD